MATNIKISQFQEVTTIEGSGTTMIPLLQGNPLFDAVISGENFISGITKYIHQGVDGSSGTSGIDGSSGVNGTSGVDGTSGSSGVDGTSGIDGTSGSSGVDGTSGIDGTSGSSGTDGTV